MDSSDTLSFQLFTKVMNLLRRFGVDKSHIPWSPPLALLGCPGAASPLRVEAFSYIVIIRAVTAVYQTCFPRLLDEVCVISMKSSSI